MLEYRNTKLAVVEAKARDEALTEGVAQAKNYAGKLAIRFTYSTNGQGIYGIDMQEGTEGDVPRYPHLLHKPTGQARCRTNGKTIDFSRLGSGMSVQSRHDFGWGRTATLTGTRGFVRLIPFKSSAFTNRSTLLIRTVKALPGPAWPTTFSSIWNWRSSK